MRSTSLFLATLLFAQSASADAPRVVADVAPIHSLVAQVMDGIGEPDLLIPASASPHGFSLKVSQARMLGDADAVFWVGEALAPWLEQALAARAADDALLVELLEAEGLTLIEAEGSDDDDHEHGHEHEHGLVDPHIWLDPVNARHLVHAIAKGLSQIDPKNAPLYASNARDSVARLEALDAEIADQLAPFAGMRSVVFHDGYRYFEARYGLGRAIALTDADGARPGARRLSETRAALRESGAACVFSEPQHGSRTLSAMLRGTDAREAVLDPLGSEHTPGPQLYEATLRGLAGTLAECLADGDS